MDRERNFRPVPFFYTEAEDVCKRIAASKDTEAGIASRKGLVKIYVIRGMIEKAISYYNSIIELQSRQLPYRLRTHLDFAELYALQGNYQRAIECIDAGLADMKSMQRIEYYPTYIMLWAMYMKGDYYLGVNQFQKAISIAEKINNLITEQPNPKLIRIYYLLKGKIELKKGDTQKAIVYFEKALEQLPMFTLIGHVRSEYLLTIAGAYLKKGDLENAEKHAMPISISLWERYISPVSYPKSLLLLGKIYQQKSWKAKAIEYYRKFIDLWKDGDEPLQPLVEDARNRIKELEK